MIKKIQLQMLEAYMIYNLNVKTVHIDYSYLMCTSVFLNVCKWLLECIEKFM